MLAPPNPEMRSPATRQSDRANSQSSISGEKCNVPTIDFQAGKSLGEHALDYARRGWHVFPCKPSNKAPYIAGGLNRATTDPDVIAEWWGQWPHAMIGVRMGEVSGVWALDPDGPAELGAADGRANWSELVAKNGGCPATHTHRTPGGGLHLLFKWREDRPITNREGRLKGLGINVRGNGGYVIAPPSCRHDGKTYDIAEPRDLFNFAEAPEWLYDLILMKPAEGPVMVQSAARALSARPYAEAALQGEAHEVAATITGNRNSRLNIAAVKLGTLVASGELSEGEVVDALYDSAVANGSVAGDGHRQTVATIRSGMRHGLQNPRLILERDISTPLTTMQDPAPQIRATPYVWRDPSSIPRREFLYGFHLIRRFTSAKFAAGGVGKSILALTEAIAMATGRPVLGIRPRQRCRVWYWNGEDPRDETDRRIAAICLHFGIAASELEGWLFVDSGRDQKIIIASQNPRTGTVIATPVVRALVDTILDNKIDALTIDPFISSHRVTENDNPAMDLVAKQWTEIADETNSAIELIHHTKKTGGAEATVEDGRGAVALLAAVRSAEVLNRMTAEEGAKAGVTNHREYFKVENGKANLASPPAGKDWYRIISVSLGNGENASESDSVGVVTSWKWPDPLEGVTGSDFEAAAAAIRAGRWRESNQAKDWVGRPIAQALRLDLDNRQDKAKVNGLVKVWIAQGSLIVTEEFDEKSMKRKFVQIAEPA